MCIVNTKHTYVARDLHYMDLVWICGYNQILRPHCMGVLAGEMMSIARDEVWGIDWRFGQYRSQVISLYISTSSALNCRTEKQWDFFQNEVQITVSWIFDLSIWSKRREPKHRVIFIRDVDSLLKSTSDLNVKY